MTLAKALFTGRTDFNSLINKPKDTTTEKMQKAIKEWFKLYFERKPTEQEDPCQRIPFAIVSKLTKAVFSEYKSDVSDKETNANAAWLDKNLSNIDKIRKEAMQWTLIGGECFLKPVQADDVFVFRVIRRDRYRVLSRAFDGSINGVEIEEECSQGSKFYTLIEKRTIAADGFLRLENTLYESSVKAERGKAVPLSTVQAYSSLPDCFTFPIKIGLGLVHIKTPIENCVDGSEDGVSVYEPAVGLVHNININEKQLADEFELGRMRITVSSDMLVKTDFENNKIALVDKIFTGLEDIHSDMGIIPFNPTLRNDSYEQRKQSYLKSCENVIGLKRGILSDVEASERTAKEITSTEGEYQLSIIDFQQMWYDSVRSALELCIVLASCYRMKVCNKADVKQLLTMSWGNGVLYDERQEWQDSMEMAASNILRPEYILAKKYDLPCETESDLQAIRTKYMPPLLESEV